MTTPLESKAVIITGASSGIGAATARAFSAAGACVTLNARRGEKLAELAADLPEQRTQWIAGDCSSPEIVHRMVDATLARFGRVDVVVNNAGIAPRLDIQRTTLDFLQATFRTNAFGPALLIAAAWPALCANGRGVIVNVSSLSAIDPLDGFFVYGASKSALESLCRSAVREGRQAGIEAYTVRLGAVETPLLRSLFDFDFFPADRALPPERVAEVIVECASGKRRHESGEITEVLA